jgi:hypothetical protein
MNLNQMITAYAKQQEWTKELETEFRNAIASGELNIKLAKSMMWSALSPHSRMERERNQRFKEARAIELSIKNG